MSVRKSIEERRMTHEIVRYVFLVLHALASVAVAPRIECGSVRRFLMGA